MQSRFLNLAAVLLVVVVVAGAIWLARRGARQEALTPPTAVSGDPTAAASRPVEEIPGLKIEGAEITQLTPAGELDWKVVANGDMQLDKASGRVQGHDVRFEMQQQGQSPLVVTAPEFVADYARQRLHFKAGVTGKLTEAEGGFAVKTLDYQIDTRKFVGSGGASFNYGAYEATAQEIVVDTDQRRVRLRGNVRFAAQG